MGGIARLACELGHAVSGSDANTYPPMSTQLSELGIALTQGYDAEFLQARPDLVLVGNALTRGNPAVEALLDSDIPYASGPQWLREAMGADPVVIEARQQLSLAQGTRINARAY